MRVTTQTVVDLVVAERERQDRLKAEGRFAFTCADRDGLHDTEKLAVLTEVVGEVARAVLELKSLVNASGNTDLRAELVQVAAVAVAWLESLIGDSTEEEPR